MSAAESVRGYCVEWFSEAHGITTEETEELFARCDLNDYIRRDFLVFGHKGRNTSIRVCRNHLKRNGIDVPDHLPEKGLRTVIIRAIAITSLASG